MKKLKPKTKKLLIAGICLVLAAAIGVGVFLTSGKETETVGVYPFHYIGMTEYWGDSQESYGPVSTDKIQTVYLTDTQTVTETLVSVGDMVKKGDLLMTFDTTLSDISVERKRLDVEKVKLQLEDAKRELQRIREMKPMVLPDPSDPEEPDTDLGTKLKDPYKISTDYVYSGKSQSMALICWIRDDTTIDDTLLEAIRLKAEEYRNWGFEAEPSSASALPTDTTEETSAEGSGSTEPVPVTEPEPTVTDPTDPKPTDPQPTDPTDPVDPKPTDPTDPVDPTDPQPTEPEQEYVYVNSYYVVIKTTAGNMSLGSRTLWQGLKVQKNEDGTFRFSFFDAYSVPDHMVILEDGSAEDVSQPEIDFGSGYTSAQLAQMRADQEQKIKDLEFDIKVAEADYKIMLLEVQDSNVYAQIDGEVVSVLTEDEAKMNQEPILKVSGGGGFYLEGSISELSKDDLQIGQEVTVNDWRNGGTYTGTVTAIGNFPSRDNWNGSGNPNASYYPFTVFVDETADLEAGRYASIMYSTDSSEHGIYLEKAFIRTEQGKSYVYVLGAGNKLERRDVVTGKSLWGSYTEILSGITEEDLIAFPYGKTVKEGAPAEEKDISDLYRY